GNPIVITIPLTAQNISWTFLSDTSAVLINLPDTTPIITATQTGSYFASAQDQNCNREFAFHLIDTCFSQTPPESYYWIGGSGNFEDTLHWATASGGTIHPLAPPNFNSNIYFDNNSGITPTDTIALNAVP